MDRNTCAATPTSALKLDQLSGTQIEHRMVRRGRQSWGARILVVEDDLALMRAIRGRLLRRHYSVEASPGGPLALAAYERFRPDLVLFDVEQRRVLRCGQPVYLTPTEYDLLKQFVLLPDRVLTDQLLLEGVWGNDRKPSEHALHVYIARLRKKLENDPQSPAYLITEVGAGYRLAI